MDIGGGEFERAGVANGSTILVLCCCYHEQYPCSCYESSTISIYGYTEAIEITLKQYLSLVCIYGATDTLLTISDTYQFS